MKRVVFKLEIQSFTDVITNSSSELFVFKDRDNADIVRNLLDSVCPDWRSEYFDVKLVSELDIDDLESYIYYSDEYDTVESVYDKDGNLIGFKDNLDYKKDERYYYYSRWFKKHNLFEEDLVSYEASYGYFQFNFENLTDKGKEVLMNFYKSSNNALYFLYSKGENPNWENQELIGTIATRIHLG